MSALHRRRPLTLQQTLRQLHLYLNLPSTHSDSLWVDSSYFSSHWLSALHEKTSPDFVDFYSKFTDAEAAIHTIFCFLRRQRIFSTQDSVLRMLEQQHTDLVTEIRKRKDMEETTIKPIYDVEDIRGEMEWVEMLGPLGDDWGERREGKEGDYRWFEICEDPGLYEEEKPTVSIDDFRSIPPSILPSSSILSSLYHYSLPSPPKKEYFRCQHIRAIKKSIRQIRKSTIPHAGIHRVEKDNQVQMEMWDKMKKFIGKFGEQLGNVGDTQMGPMTDGKKKRKSTSPTLAKSFNNAFCRAFFHCPFMQAYNLLFCDLVYSTSPQILCAKLKIRCCLEGEHTKKCESAWADLKHYAQSGLLDELHIPVIPSTIEPLEDGFDLLA